MAEQAKHIKIILDYAALNHVYLEDELRNTTRCDMLWFQFTYTTKIPTTEN